MATASHLPSLDPKIARHWVPSLNPGQLAFAKLAGTPLRKRLVGQHWGKKSGVGGRAG